MRSGARLRDPFRVCAGTLELDPWAAAAWPPVDADMSTQAPEAPAASGYAPRGKDNGIVKSKGTVNLPRPEGREPVQHRARKPEWLKVRAPGGANYLRLKGLMR